MPEKSPAFQFYPKDWLSDENVAALSKEEEADYIRLICFCWLEGSIPAELAQIELLLKPDREGNRMIDPVVYRCFEPDPNNPSRLVHPRLEKERKKQKDWREKCSVAGKASADARRAKRKAEAKGSTTTVQPNVNTSVSSLQSSSSTKNIKTLKDKDICTEVINCLNEKAGRKFKNIDTHHQWIRARINEGFKLEDFMKVVDTQVKLWKDDPEMNRYLRPYTLFGNKMDGYLNTQPEVEKKRTKSRAEEKRDVGDSWLKRSVANEQGKLSKGVKGILE